MNIDIENLIAQNVNGQAGFFQRFALGDPDGVRFTIAVPTKLQPHIEFAVMGQKQLASSRID